MDVVTQCLEALKGTMTQQTERLWIFGFSSDKVFLLLFRDGVSLPHMDPMHNLGLILDLQFLLEE